MLEIMGFIVGLCHLCSYRGFIIRKSVVYVDPCRFVF
jgi:hypothetical protein